MSRFSVFFENIQRDIKTYVFLLLLFCLYRGAFIWIMQSYIEPNTGMTDIALAMWAGFRLSLKSAGVLVLLSFLVCTMSNVLVPKLKTDSIRLWMGGFYIAILSILFQARFPYYNAFHVTFNQNVFNTMNDDVYALFITMIQEYNLPVRLLGALVILYFLYFLFKTLLKSPNYPLPHFTTKTQNLFFRVFVVMMIPIFMIFMRFGGSFNYNHSINWENGAITKSSFLNEAILDDMQALYRAYAVHDRMAQGDQISGIHKEKIREYSKLVAGNNVESDDLTPYLARQAAGAQIAKPRHIFIVIGETYSQWPLMEKFDKLNLANGLKDIIKQDDTAYTQAFLPNASFTAMAVTALVTGLSDVSIPVNYQQRSYEQTYITALAPQMQKLGYKVDFWYGGFPSWERIKDFTLAQGFDHFYSCADFGAEPDNIWGTKDEYIFQALSKHLDKEAPTVHLILTVSNHPPYNLDLDKAGFDAAKIMDGLPEDQKNNKELIRKLGHYWYMDKVVHDFVKETKEKYPDSLFIITGDHSDRVNVTDTPTPYERYTIPLVISGPGITKALLPSDIAGSQVNIMPTLIELLAPKGFTYYSIANSLTKGNQIGFNNDYSITPYAIGKITNPTDYEVFNHGDLSKIEAAQDSSQDKISMMRTLSWWLLVKGNQL